MSSATTTLTPLTPAQRQARREAEALAEMERNGITFRPLREKQPARKLVAVTGAACEMGLGNAPDTYDATPVAPLPPKCREVYSRPDAKPMGREDICNVQFLNLETAREILEAVGKSAPKLAARALQHVEENYRTLLTEGERFALSAMAARKFMRELQPA